MRRYLIVATGTLAAFVGRNHHKVKLRLPDDQTAWFDCSELATEDGQTVPVIED